MSNIINKLKFKENHEKCYPKENKNKMRENSRLTVINLEKSINTDMKISTEQKKDILIQALDKFVDGVYISDQECSLLYTSPSLQNVFGTPGKKKCFNYLFNRNNICPWCKNEEVFSGNAVSWEQDFHSYQKVFEILELPLFYSDKIMQKLTIFRDITDRRQAEEQLKLINVNLIEEQVKLRKMNVTLKEILNQYKSGKDLVEKQTQTNINRFILPILGDLENGANENQKMLIKALKESLGDITSPFINQLENKYSSLSPRESEICKLIKEEYSSKDIAATLGLSVQTIHLRRKHIRKKLGISNKKVNLSIFLKSS